MRSGVVVVIVALCGCWRGGPGSTTTTTSGGAPQPRHGDGRVRDGDLIEEPENDPVGPPNNRPVQLAAPSPKPSPYPDPLATAHPPPQPSQTPAAIAASNRPKRELGDLVLRGKAQETLAGDDDTEITRACVRDQAKLVVQDGAAITLTGNQPTIIAGQGIVPAPGVTHLHVRIDVPSSADVYLLFDNATIPISALVYAPSSTVHIAITGRAGLTLERGGIMKSAHYYGGFGEPKDFPSCP